MLIERRIGSHGGCQVGQRLSAAAEGFFAHGPGALRELRVRHALPPGALSRPVIEALLSTELRTTIAAHRVDLRARGA